MENIEQKIKNISQMEFPDSLHGKIMKKLLFLQFRVPFLIVVGLLILNLGFTTWHIWSNIAEAGGVDVIRGLLTEFQWNVEYLNNLFVALNEFISYSSILSLTLELAIIIYVFHLSSTFKKMSLTVKA